MLTYLENLRKLPEPERKKAVLKITVSIMLVIVSVWIVSLWFRIAQTDFSFDSNGVERKIPSLRETFSGFADQIGNIFEGEAPNGSSSPRN